MLRCDDGREERTRLEGIVEGHLREDEERSVEDELLGLRGGSHGCSQPVVAVLLVQLDRSGLGEKCPAGTAGP